MFLRACALACFCLSSSSLFAGHTLTNSEQRVLDSWLAVHTHYRVARDADCHCAVDIRQLRKGFGGVWKPVPDYRPYVVTGDLNSDGIEDFAVMVIDKRLAKRQFTLLVFNGPFDGSPKEPQFISRHLVGYALFFGPPRPKPWRLITGPFESDNTSVLVPKGKTYRWE
jgi:hypothetical protein